MVDPIQPCFDNSLTLEIIPPLEFRVQRSQSVRGVSRFKRVYDPCPFPELLRGPNYFDGINMSYDCFNETVPNKLKTPSDTFVVIQVRVFARVFSPLISPMVLSQPTMFALTRLTIIFARYHAAILSPRDCSSTLSFCNLKT